MRTQFYQVTGAGAFTVDYPTGNTIAHRAKAIFEAHPTNKSVVRGLRTRRIRTLSQRESDAMRSHAKARADLAAKPAAKASAKPAAKTRSAPRADPGDEPIVVLPDSK